MSRPRPPEKIVATQEEAAPAPRRRKSRAIQKEIEGAPSTPTIWSKLKAGSPGGNSNWATTATEELEQFRKVPLVGNLPWKTQYVLATFGLLLCLLFTMVFVSMGRTGGAVASPNNIYVQSTAQQLVDLAQKALDGAPVDAATIDRLTKQGSAASKNVGSAAAKDWDALAASMKVVASSSVEAAGASDAARKVAGLRQGLATVAPLWRQAGEGGEWTSVTAVNLAQVLAQLQSMGSIAEGVVVRKEAVGSDFPVYRQSLEQAFRVYSASPEATQNTLLAQAWRSAATAFVAVRQPAEALSTRAPAWDRLVDSARSARAARDALAKSAAVTAGASSGAEARDWPARAAWMSAFGALLFLLLLLWVGWKQQRWHVLSARAAQELVEREAQELMRSVQGVEHGDLTTRIPVSSHVLGTLGDSINRTVGGIRHLVEGVRNNADATGSAANQAATATGVLAEGMQEQLTHLVDSGGVILRISEQSQTASSQARAALEVAEQTQELAGSGLQASAGSREHIQEIRKRNEDAADRAERLKKSSREIAGIADVINDIAEQTEVLAAQASLQANKAGEHGRGFLVVAAGVRDLAERSGEYARRVNARIETALADLDKLSEAFGAALAASDEGARLSDVSQETWISTDARLALLRDRLFELQATVDDQNQEVQHLGDSTQEALQQVEVQRRQAELARQSVGELLDSSGTLRDSVSMFRV